MTSRRSPRRAPPGPALPADALLGAALDTVTTLRVRIAGRSMAPLLITGDRVEVTRCSGAGLRPGEIVLFRRGTDLVVHRFLFHTPQGLAAKGDAAPFCDPLWHPDECEGRVVVRERKGARFRLDMCSQVARGLCIAAYWRVRHVLQRWRRRARRRDDAGSGGLTGAALTPRASRSRTS